MAYEFLDPFPHLIGVLLCASIVVIPRVQWEGGEDIRDYTISEGIAEKFARRFGAGVAAAVMEWALRAAPVIR